MFNFVQNFKNASLKSFRVDLPDEYAFPASYPGAKDYPTPQFLKK